MGIMLPAHHDAPKWYMLLKRAFSKNCSSGSSLVHFCERLSFFAKHTPYYFSFLKYKIFLLFSDTMHLVSI
jgi:hypothetical protein